MPLNKPQAGRQRTLQAANRDGKPGKEPALTQVASFAELFVWLLVLKAFFLPLFVIPTGSMAETLAGQHAFHTCPNCGFEYKLGYHNGHWPPEAICPNCFYTQPTDARRPNGFQPHWRMGDRIVVHGWTYPVGIGPDRWDVVVFKVPKDAVTNYIKRLIGLSGETIRILDGDIYVRAPGGEQFHIARKPEYAQEALWLPVYRHNFRPQQPGMHPYQAWLAGLRAQRRGRPMTRTALERAAFYLPRFVAGEGAAWSGLEERVLEFNGTDAARGEVTFVTAQEPSVTPARIWDFYGYNGPIDINGDRRPDRVLPEVVTDTRLAGEIEFVGGEGYVELGISKYADRFYARLFADGRLVVEHDTGTGAREVWVDRTLVLPDMPVSLAIAHADYRLTVEVNDELVFASQDDQYSADLGIAYQRAQQPRRKPQQPIRIAAAQVHARIRDVEIDRDVHYLTEDPDRQFVVADDGYFVLGDNSPASADSRAWRADELGPHLREKYAAGEYILGNVPASDMIGRAFFVYFPGTQPLTRWGPPILPDTGRIRWIR